MKTNSYLRNRAHTFIYTKKYKRTSHKKELHDIDLSSGVIAVHGFRPGGPGASN